MKLVIMRLKQKIQANPMDRQAREDLARTYDEVGRRAEAAEQRRKARQCERFNPDYDYASKLKPLGLEATRYAGGEIVTVQDDLWVFWADPAELQSYLEQTPPEDLDVRDLPIYEHMPSEHHLQRLWETLPGQIYRSMHPDYSRCQFKELEGGSWIVREESKNYHWWPQLPLQETGKSDLVAI